MTALPRKIAPRWCRAGTRCCAALSLAWLFACSAPPRLLVPVDEYAQFRKTRLAHSVEARLSAGQAYLSSYPKGQWSAEVRHWFDELEPRYYAAARNNPSTLGLYLEALKNGPHAREARRRLRELELVAAAAERRERELVAQARATEIALARAERQRRRLVALSLGWVRRLTRVNSFGLPSEDLDHEFIYGFRLEAPRGQCRGSSCEKSLHLDYAIPLAAGPSARHAELQVKIELSRGAVTRVIFQGRDWFTHLAAAAAVGPAARNESLARAEAIGRATYLIAVAAERRFPSAKCATPAVSPVVLRRQCGGVRLLARAGLTPGDLDSVLVEAAGDAPGSTAAH